MLSTVFSENKNLLRFCSCCFKDAKQVMYHDLNLQALHCVSCHISEINTSGITCLRSAPEGQLPANLPAVTLISPESGRLIRNDKLEYVWLNRPSAHS